jgi:RNA polymerase sigma-32 factor
MNYALTTMPGSLACATASLDAYIQSAQRAPLLTEQEELDLARRFRDHNDLDAARALVLSHLRLVIAIARGYLGYGLPHADLIQEGSIGLMKAVRRFDPARGVRLVSFAIHWIKAEIHEYIIRNWRLVKIATTKAQRKLFFNLRSLKQGLGTLGTADVDAMAATLGVKPQDVREMETRLSGHDCALDASPADEEETSTRSPAHWLAADSSYEPEHQIEQRARDYLENEGLTHALASLDARSQDIIRRRWLSEDTDHAPTLHDLGAQYGVSAERIRQIETRALQKLKACLAASHD